MFVFPFPLFIMAHSITVAEKQHWRNRIAERIDRSIEAICLKAPGFLDNVRKKARQRALKSLGIDALAKRIAETEARIDSLQRKKSNLNLEMLAKLRGVSVDDVDRNSVYMADRKCEQAVSKRQLHHEEELLQATSRGRKILRLRAEKDGLIDTVWLATSGQQVKDLWAKVDDLLGGSPTTLQTKVMETPASEGE